MACRDRLLANVPRSTEVEPGLTVSLLPSDKEAVANTRTTAGYGAAVFDPLARRWLGQPLAQIDASSPAWVGTTPVVTVDNQAAGGLGALVALSGSKWTIWHPTPLDLNRGYYLDLWVYQPETGSTAWSGQQLELAWGAADINGGVTDPRPAPKWRVVLTPNETGPGLASVFDRAAGDAAVLDLALLSGPFFNQLHRLWFQPLDDATWLLRNRDHATVGAVLRTDKPHAYDPDRGHDGDDGPPVAYAPWGPGQFTLSGAVRAWVVLRPLTYPSSWSVEAWDQPFGYLCTTDVEQSLNCWLPDGRYPAGLDSNGDPTGSQYDVQLTVTTGGPDDPEWTEHVDGSDTYGWCLTATGPRDVGGSDYSDARGRSFRTLTIDRAELHWPQTLTDDGAVAVDLLAHPHIKVIAGPTETRSHLDHDARLSFTLQGPVTELKPLARPAVRWQWVLDLADGAPEPNYYIRFDGLRDSGSLPVWRTVEDEWQATVELTLASRWRQGYGALFRGNITLDGCLRSEAYRRLAKLLPLSDGEILIAELDHDAVLEPSLPGEPAAWHADVGKCLTDLLFGLADTAGPRDRLLFVDRGGCTSVLRVDTPSPDSVATLYRTQAEADAAGVPGQCIVGPDGLRLLDFAEDDRESYNEFIVCGRRPVACLADSGAGGPTESADRGELMVAYYADQASWTTAQVDGQPNPFYLGFKKTFVGVFPELQTPEAVEQRALGLVRQFGRFRAAGHVHSNLLPRVYPGDLLTIEPGTQPDEVARLLEVRGMTTQTVSLELPLTGGRYLTVYELGEPPR